MKISFKPLIGLADDFVRFIPQIKKVVRVKIKEKKEKEANDN